PSGVGLGVESTSSWARSQKATNVVTSHTRPTTWPPETFPIATTTGSPPKASTVRIRPTHNQSVPSTTSGGTTQKPAGGSTPAQATNPPRNNSPSRTRSATTTPLSLWKNRSTRPSARNETPVPAAIARARTSPHP